MPSLGAIEKTAELAEPVVQALADAVGTKLSEFAGSISSREGQSAQWRLSRQRFLRPSEPSAALDNVPADVDWEMRKLELSETIARRITQPRLTEQAFFQAVREFPHGDRQIVGQILEQSAGSATELGLMRSFNSVAAKLEQQFSGQRRYSLAASPESPGNMLSYLFRKAQLGQGRTLHLGYSGAGLRDLSGDSPLLVFDDLRYLNASDRATLIDLQKQRPVVAIDVGSFERAVNFIDFAHGQPTVVAKLDRLLNETKELLRQEPGLEQEQAIKRVLSDGFDQSVAAVNSEREQGVNPIITLRPEPVSALDALKPVVTPDQIVSFLEEHFSDSSDARIAAAELLTEDVEFHTLQGLIPKLKDLQEALRLSAQRQGIEPEKDIFVVAAEGASALRGLAAKQGASSEAFMTYLYKQATGMADGRIVTLPELQALQKESKLAGARVVALDDAIYNGWQADELLDKPLSSFPRVALAALSSGNRFAKLMREGGPLLEWNARTSGMRELVSLQTDFGLGVSVNGSVNPFYAGMPARLREMIGSIDPVSGLQTLKVFPHMVSDTSPYWLHMFSRRFPLTFGHAVSLK